MNLGDFDIPVPATDGSFISEKHARISELISEYDADLSLAWIPPARREPGDKPFAVVCSPLGRPPYVVCYADDCDERLLARVYSMDGAKGNVGESIDANNKAVRDLQKKKYEDAMADQYEFAQSVLKSPKSVYKHNGVKYT
jgi:hypothetical protein